MIIVIANRQRTKPINSRQLKQIVQTLLIELKLESADLGINLVSAKEMVKVNWTFLGHKGSTDIITFDHAEGGADSAQPTDGAHGVSRLTLYGELFICVDEAVAQAKQFRTTWQSEVVRYVVHGVLHLLGHDDLKPARRREMKRVENRLVRLLSRQFSLAQLADAVKLRA